ncbi:aminopeptidase N [Kordiimonas sp.]|uniref:aminopeptidase N n=1 Tax=Kordiimonas sp. TaxID=1970157 RepID=UPI003A8D68E8
MDASTAAVAPKQEIKLADYKPSAFVIEGIHLTFKLYPELVEVTATSRLRRVGDATDLVLDGGPYMRLVSVAIDGERLAGSAYTLSDDGLVLHDVPDAFSLTIVTELKPKENTRLEGLYYSGGNFCTQCEAEGFRHITYFLDRPDVLTTYDVRIEADKTQFPLLLANGNPGASGTLEEGRHYAEWHDPHPKPCYLFAMVAGDLACLNDTYTTQSGQQVELNIYAAKADIAKCDYAMGSLKRAMKWDEEVFGLEYDLDVYNIVAVSDFNMGAMENKGLNIFNTKYVLASPETATDTDFDHIEGVIGHEYFHNWTGNRVTCRDWFQLSLKEGLTVFRDQEFSSDMTSRAVKRLDDVRTLRMLQFPEDAGPLAHPVRPESYIEINNFYTTTVYNKGAEVIRMMHRFIGADAFRRGMDLYFERHDGEAATCEDFVVAMEAASGTDLSQFRLWYSQAGTPTLTVTRSFEDSDVILAVEQACAATPGQPIKHPMHMPLLIGWLDKNGVEVKPSVVSGGKWTTEGCLLDVKSTVQHYHFKDVPVGAVPSLLRGFSAPVTLKHDLNAEELALLVRADADPFARWEASQSLYSVCLQSCIAGAAEPSDIPEYILDAFTGLIEDRETDQALLAELLTLPSEISLGQQLETLLPQEIHIARHGVTEVLAQRFGDQIVERYCELAHEPYSLTKESKANRRLKNALLRYIAHMPQAEELVTAQLRQADNMTDKIAALAIVASSDVASCDALLSAFYEEWKADDLVIDKWFALQAQNTRTDAVSKIRDLMGHPAFKYTNPNRLRSLISTFSMLNQCRFHDASGEGYTLLADTIAKMDQINPQTAARLVAPLGRWRRLPDALQVKMKGQLEQLRSRVESDDVRELVEKSL